MVIKLREGCLVNTKDIRMVNVACMPPNNQYHVIITYYDEKKNPSLQIQCNTKDDANELVEELLANIKELNRIKFY